MSAERFTLDTNILVYAFDSGDATRRKTARLVLDAARKADCVLTAQSLGEFFNVARRKLDLALPELTSQIRDWMAMFRIAGASEAAVRVALEQVEAERFSYWDALLLSAAEQAGCSFCLSEDMAEGARLGALTIHNPFTPAGQLSAKARGLLAL